jgi:hypothetical protein
MGTPPPQMEFRLSDHQSFSQLPEGSPIGVAGQCLEVARDYALRREHFRVPIGTFEALSHLMADMLVVA